MDIPIVHHESYILELMISLMSISSIDGIASVAPVFVVDAAAM
jgi:hypothetical protein